MNQKKCGNKNNKANLEAAAELNPLNNATNEKCKTGDGSCVRERKNNKNKK